jgi:hypothetical protein
MLEKLFRLKEVERSDLPRRTLRIGHWLPKRGASPP